MGRYKKREFLQINYLNYINLRRPRELGISHLNSDSWFWEVAEKREWQKNGIKKVSFHPFLKIKVWRQLSNIKREKYRSAIAWWNKQDKQSYKHWWGMSWTHCILYLSWLNTDTLFTHFFLNIKMRKKTYQRPTLRIQFSD